jgi:hypothetical protein
VYFIWYGNWGNLNNNGTASRPTTVKVLTDMIMSIGNTAWMQTATSYSDNSGAATSNIKYGGRAVIKSGSCYKVRREIPLALFRI